MSVASWRYFYPDYEVMHKFSAAVLRAAATLAVQNVGYENLKEMQIKEFVKGQLTFIDFPCSLNSWGCLS